MQKHMKLLLTRHKKLSLNLYLCKVDNNLRKSHKFEVTLFILGKIIFKKTQIQKNKSYILWI